VVENTERAALRQAARHVTAAELALWLGVPMRLLKLWMLGMAAMPERKFLLVLDLLDKLGDPGGGESRMSPRSNVRQLRGGLSP
jgi:hypothetical protein